MPDTKTLSIGEVINQLRDEFPDVSVSKIRFLESQGLIDPDRSDSGYRKFDSQDVARLSFILQQQRDHFLPLKVIKSKLTLWERGEDLDSRVAGSESNASSGEPLSREEVLKRSGLTDQQLQELLDAGVIRHIPDSTVFHSEIGVAALEAKRLMDIGLEARHLRAIRLSVDREADLLRQLTAPLMRARNPESQARARDLLESSTGSVQALHRALLAGELKQPPVQ
ncbi:MAG: MerR family transcriptional regulator [Actinobacteria bacterium]|nr:MerR family transcriptional regulator [Actinomycetota bacterium]